MSKTAPIPEDIHLLIIEKQLEIFKKYGVHIRISDIIATIMRNYIDNIEECLRTEGKIGNK